MNKINIFDIINWEDRKRIMNNLFNCRNLRINCVNQKVCKLKQINPKSHIGNKFQMNKFFDVNGRVFWIKNTDYSLCDGLFNCKFLSSEEKINLLGISKIPFLTRSEKRCPLVMKCLVG